MLRIIFAFLAVAIASPAPAATPAQIAALRAPSACAQFPNLVAEWDFTDPGTLQLGTGVAAVRDKTGNGYDLSQATGSAQPTLNTTALPGFQVLQFASASSQFFTMAKTLDVSASGFTMVAVARRGGVSGTNVLALVGKNGGNGFMAYQQGDDRVYVGGGTNYWTTSVAVGLTGFYVLATTGNAANVITAMANGVVQAGNNSASLGGLTFDWVGRNFGTNYTNGLVARICVYSGTKTTTEQQTISRVLRARYRLN